MVLVGDLVVLAARVAGPAGRVAGLVVRAGAAMAADVAAGAGVTGTRISRTGSSRSGVSLRL